MKKINNGLRLKLNVNTMQKGNCHSSCPLHNLQRLVTTVAMSTESWSLPSDLSKASNMSMDVSHSV